MTRFACPLSFENEFLGVTINCRPWQAPQLGQTIAGKCALRPSNLWNSACYPVSVPQKLMLKLEMPESPQKIPPLRISPTPSETTLYINDPYSLENFTPPPPQLGEVPGDVELEMDEHKIQQRLKQIGFGKSTKGYETYLTLVTQNNRELGNEDHPLTPRADQKCSKRSWDGQLKKWRRLLHRWDDVLQSPSSSDADGSEKDLSAGTDEDTPTSRSCALSLLTVFDEPRIHSWASECSDVPNADELCQSECAIWKPPHRRCSL